MKNRSVSTAILAGGLVAGTLDISYAIAFLYAYRGTAPMKLLQSVASGLLGPAASQGGWGTAMLGLALHFCIAFIWASIFVIASQSITFLKRHAVVSGISYGVLIYAAMNFIVVPLSAVPKKVAFPVLTFPMIVLVTGLLVHAVCIGLPIAFFAKKSA